MSNEKSKPEQAAKNSGQPKDANEMAVERTLMATDRSMMAWVRTGLALISFGFTIYKFLDIQRQQLIEAGKIVPAVSGPKVFGLLMIGIGILSLVMGTVEYLETIPYQALHVFALSLGNHHSHRNHSFRGNHIPV